MKNYFCVILLLLSSITFSQKFEFDFVTVYEIKSENKLFETMIYTNSKDDHYVLKLFYDADGKITGFIRDNRHFYLHYFAINVISEVENKVEFDYLYSKNFNSIKLNDHEFQFLKKPIDSVRSILVVNCYFNKKRKRPIQTYTLEVLEFESNKFGNFRNSFHHFYENDTKFNPTKNYLVQSFSYKNAFNETIIGKLINSKEVKINIEVNSIVDLKD